MSLSLEVIYDTIDKGRRVVVAKLPDASVLPAAEKIYGPSTDGNIKRSTERYASRILLGQLYPGAIMEHGRNREPLLVKCKWYKEISVSHTSDKIALVFSNANTGIDMEKTERYMGRVAGRFLSEKERETVGENGLVAAWCAKEAFYKYLKGNGVVFLNEYNITSFSPEKIVIEHMGKSFDIVISTLGDTTLAYI